MKKVLVSFAVSLGCAMACGQTVKAQAADSLPLVFPENYIPSLTPEEIENNIGQLNGIIGGYPPRFENPGHRLEVYRFWLEQVAEAEHFAAENKDQELAHVFRADLYRQGHNMDVSGAAERTIENLNLCFREFEMPIMCHRTAMFFYVSVGGKYVDEAEKHVTFLKNYYGDDLDHDVEQGLIWLKLFRGDMAGAKSAIPAFLENFPNSNNSELLEMILKDSGQIRIVNQPSPDQPEPPVQ